MVTLGQEEDVDETSMEKGRCNVSLWTSLPCELVGSIASLLPFLDFVHLSTVCSWWALALNAPGVVPSKSPWLLLPNKLGEAAETLTFLDMCTGHHLCISGLKDKVFGRRWFGSKDGWLVTLDIADLQPRLLNPLTKAEITFPSLLTIPKDFRHNIKVKYKSDGIISRFVNLRDGSYLYAHEFRDLHFHKIVVSSNDPSGTAVVIYGFLSKQLAMARPGDCAWFIGPKFRTSRGKYDEFEDVIFHEKDGRFYAITALNSVISFDINGDNIKVISSARLFPGVCIIKSLTHYIVFFQEEVHRIERRSEFIDLPNEKQTQKTLSISVFKLRSRIDLASSSSSSSSSQWLPVTDLGDFCFFIGCNQTTFLHHRNAPGLRRNCIYFSDGLSYMHQDDVRDVGAYDVGRSSFEYFFDVGSHPTWPPSIWFTPSTF